MSHNIIVEPGKSRLLKTAGKVCDRDIVVTAIGGGDGPVVSGTIEITDNGEYNVAAFEKANVQVPIPEGYIQPSGTKEIDENGTYDVREYESVEVNIESGGEDRTAMENGLISRTLTEYINNTVTSIGTYAFGNFTSLKYVSLPNVTEFVGGNHFASCTNLKRINIPNLKTSISSAGNNFRQCSSLEELRVPLYNGTLAVSGCTSLKTYECATPYNIASSAFSNLPAFDTLVMHCTKVVPLANISAFNGTPFAAGGTGGTVYVPQRYVEQYKTATNWSSLYEAGTCEFVAIEGSEYE